MSARARFGVAYAAARLLVAATAIACASDSEAAPPQTREPAVASTEETPAVVSARENWTDATLTVIRVADSELRGFVAAEVEILAIREVPGFLALPESVVGSTVTLLLRREKIDTSLLAPRTRIEARVRRGRDPKRLFADERTVHAAERDPQ